jgi:predicted GIY-YIG superfamily endonuclease
MHFVYILFSKIKDKYLIGSAPEVVAAVEAQNSKGFGGQRGDWILVYQEKFDDGAAALRRSKELKYKQSKKSIESLINNIPWQNHLK